MKHIVKFTSVILMVFLLFTSFGLCVSAESQNKFYYGDVDMDGAVTISDATEIQKGLASLTYLTGVQKYLADPDAIGVSIKTATSIQKHLACIEGEAIVWGNEIIMQSENKFSSAVKLTSSFEDDSILVMIKQGYGKDYTIKDFPEYDFGSVESLSEKPVIYLINLKDAGKENVLEAIKALDYRADLDIDVAQPNFIYRPAVE